jgi:predicted aspartyl protease
LLGLLALGLATPTAADVPIAIAASGHATVPVEGSFGTRQFVFDTGAEGSAVYANFAEEAGLAPAGVETLQGQTGATDVKLVRLGRLTLDGTTKPQVDVVRLEARADRVPLAGIVGLDLFGDRTVDFDLPRKRLTLLEPGTRPDGLGTAGIQATPTTGNLLTIPVRIGRVEAVAVIDTGARKTRINWALGRLLGLDASKLIKGDTIQGATNEPVDTRAARLADVALGDRRLAEAPVLIADLPVFEAFGVADRPAIILGLDWLEETRMVVDFSGRRVWFEASDAAHPKTTAKYEE